MSVTDQTRLQFNTDVVKFVNAFVYLGSTVANNRNLKTEMNCRCGLAATAMQLLWKLLWRHCMISCKPKLCIYNALVHSILLHGSETWPLNKTVAARIDVFDSQVLGTIENIRWYQRVSNEALRACNHQPAIISLQRHALLRSSAFAGLPPA